MHLEPPLLSSSGEEPLQRHADVVSVGREEQRLLVIHSPPLWRWLLYLVELALEVGRRTEMHLMVSEESVVQPFSPLSGERVQRDTGFLETAESYLESLRRVSRLFRREIETGETRLLCRQEVLGHPSVQREVMTPDCIEPQ